VRRPALACLSVCFLFAACAPGYPQQASPQQEAPQATQAPEQEKPSGKPPETPQAAETQAVKQSTPEDRQHLVAVARKLEAAPLDVTLAQERDWAVRFAVAAPDIHVRICTSLLADLRRPRYKYRSLLGDQLLLSSAAFLIEHPETADKKSTAPAISGMEGVLKAYSAIVKAEPQANTASLDALLEKQSEGTLAEAVSEKLKNCP
jgi:hypothetical protein